MNRQPTGDNRKLLTILRLTLIFIAVLIGIWFVLPVATTTRWIFVVLLGVLAGLVLALISHAKK